jgi:hypothetical protein
VVSKGLEKLSLGFGMLMLSGCGSLRVPEASLGWSVRDQVPTRVASQRLADEPRDELEVVAREQTAERTASRQTPAKPSKKDRSGDRWSDYRRAEFDERMRQHFPDWEGSWCPLVLSFDGRPVRFETTPAVPFETGGAVECGSTDWPTPTTPWLVRDLDASGTIDGGHELFGAGTRMPDGSFAENGFAALAVLDDDGDGWVTPADSAWSSLSLWFDHDRNRKSDPGELRSLDEMGVTALPLAHEIEPRCDARGNCMIEHATYDWLDREGTRRVGTLIDVHLRCRTPQP